jgi:hypothetical protein
MQHIDLAIATITNVGALYVAVVVLFWAIRLRHLHLRFLPFVVGAGVVKLALWFWSLTAIIQILIYNVRLPLYSLPARIAVMCAILAQVWVTLHYYGQRDIGGI